MTFNNSQSVIVEIRAGIGGKEAALFVSELFKMYSKYAAGSANWKARVLDSSPTELNGLKQIIFELKGENVFLKMKHEAGIHRIQRIPKTEKGSRIHTSTVSVAVFLKPESFQIKLNPNEIKMDFYKASGPGGQYVNKRQTAVRITHLPTNIIVCSQNSRSLGENKETALSILTAKLYKQEQNKKRLEIEKERKSQIKTAERAEKIRTYNFPQDRITDHRIKKSFHNIEKIMEGKLEPIFKALQSV
ncbi:peptide chain release factor 1 [bacterium (Candidatus Gribaldobacteria) CG07_land_8_20_14_0_80_33_18]|uniref:Peptide chain release factor 1 n=1 Tax=bacterium (Candidatus Gribaldobacteria) CG07_land_8_20_14_0_80_33_18 TaxID=2014272 RepID=A0A2M6Z4J5_9BACT|nr:MAG: peptide chain release factor 1 [bacterium (Candidatus Gribaldobacteria) CG10_big_fil_rev_8_21_14_0_10_33_41]PIU47310.1 MAG: peptide chain release factor 1 [bacterium (Candidatus Gribaldobacteria) CG07_land_8_20_14_0_80_33_18]PJA01346.1 MAG: peptide chain release factor 1 [bacterium (Candidatus Gribaldobacteria) CG_4_10_14_0_2_um_filter_33_15]PJB09042.1 MAG: peptide chain release factor 1 [bacterium (Candidatus Gribaldobacteria) CG_4_9_14_3_um_filter_33_9]